MILVDTIVASLLLIFSIFPPLAVQRLFHLHFLSTPKILYLSTLTNRLIAVEHAYRLKIDKEHTHTVTSASPSDPLSISTIITEIDSRDLRVKTNVTTGGTSLMASEL